MYKRSSLVLASAAVLFCNLAVFPTLAANCAPIPPGLVSWWPGEGSAADIYGPNNGTAEGVTFGPGEVGNGFVFEGGWVQVPDSPSLNLTSGISLVFWFNRDNFAGPFQGVIAKRDTNLPAPSNYGVNFSQPHYGLGLYFDDPSVGYPGNGSDDGNHFEVMRTALPTAEAWHLYVGEYRQTATGVELRAYVDDVLADAQSFPGLLANGLTELPLEIGTTIPGFEPFHGILDEIQIYNRPITERVIRRIFNAGSSGMCPPIPIPALSSQNARLLPDPAAATRDRVGLDATIYFSRRGAHTIHSLSSRELSLSIGGFTQTLEPGTLQCHGDGTCEYTGSGHGIRALSIGSGVAQVHLEGVDAALIPPGPNQMLLRLGHAIGRATIDISAPIPPPEEPPWILMP